LILIDVKAVFEAPNRGDYDTPPVSECAMTETTSKVPVKTEKTPA
jgi:hypothetical protein